LDCDMIEISGEGDIVGSLGQNSGKRQKGGLGARRQGGRRAKGGAWSRQNRPEI